MNENAILLSGYHICHIIKMEGGWQIVKFTEENDMVEAVPASWLIDGCKCLWPDTISGAKVRAAIRAKEKPSKSWKCLPVEVLSSSVYENFCVASKKAGKAKYTSELDTESEFSEDVLNKRRRKKNSRYVSSEDEISPPLEKTPRRSPRFKLPTPPGHSLQASPSSSEALVKRNIIMEKEFTDSNLMSTSRTASTAIQKCSSCKDSTEIIKLLHIINGRVMQNSELITSLLNSRTENIKDNNPAEALLDVQIPAKSYIELMELDKKLGDKTTRDFMISKLIHVGGTDIKDIIRRCMPQLVEDEVLRQFSWVGGKGKKKFSLLDIASLIKEVCKKNPLTKNVTEKQVEERLAIFLTKATERCNRRRDKENQQNNDLPEELLI
ncbi:uncharacterized protein LOC123321988 isoform X3 [Coccinella septempunctata]|uniref:uncharacterized protein LOC123312562 isoform X3 n=1 Tax=Coccinella septempunctata TaxID=41139 RepID=UPI001D07319A|nr:uncharacterized protein LOC123312562 isoform X3 [Coccinella septempunctata]XP_044758227.1 uncharacterized protein LOC123316291 isoform X3 [Coccinella septempunctata]XP_044765734.1 uncharacterized protein LOC123321988 isoform X3 [Coccinella septempunctata]